jgi:small GTP-binding protein
MFKALVNSPFRNITHTIITRTITLQPLYTFSRRAKNSQLILHSPDQVDQIIAKR